MNYIIKMARLRVVDNSNIGRQAELAGKPAKCIHVYNKQGIGYLGDKVIVTDLSYFWISFVCRLYLCLHWLKNRCCYIFPCMLSVAWFACMGNLVEFGHVVPISAFTLGHVTPHEATCPSAKELVHMRSNSLQVLSYVYVLGVLWMTSRFPWWTVWCRWQVLRVTQQGQCWTCDGVRCL